MESQMEPKMKILSNSLRYLTLVLIAVSFAIAGTATAAPKPDLWDFWSASTKTETTSVDHSAWDQILGGYIEASEDLNNFDYARLAQTNSDLQKLKNYLSTLTATDPRKLTRDQQLAYWVNLYNALTIDVVLSQWPVGSIKDIRDGVFTPGPWSRKIATVAGKEITLNDIEHRILRPLFNDPRIHYAVNCASIGCPNLQAKAFTASNAQQLLDKGAKEFINSDRGAFMAGSKLTVSSIYEWFQVDFGGDDAGVIAHLKKYATGDLAEKLKNVTKVSRDQYDWRINAISGTAPGAVMQGSDGGISTGGIETKRAQE